ncbi:hypothetical protein NF212_22860 [Parasalinivibrio latis]|uniref:hypothetical protein n=1 Tax=Parasalinivibrio latis TaxID=2952610 RepID=UPI0030E29237
MELIQKKKSTKLTFTFHDDYFNFAYKEKSGSGDLDFNYADFPQKSSVQIEQNDWLRNVGFLWMALGIFQIAYALYAGDPLSGKGFWLFVGVVCVAWAHFSKIKYSVFRFENGSVLIMQDKSHEIIVEEINKRRKTQLLQWYGEVNPENELSNEIQKFKWLTEQNIMSKEESDKKIAEAEFLHNDNFSLPGENPTKYN